MEATPLSLDQDVLRDLSVSLSCEWLLTNRLGGYASLSLSGASTRRYHGLLMASVAPPVARRLLLARLEDRLGDVALSTNEFPGRVWPEGYLKLVRFDLEPAPTSIFD